MVKDDAARSRDEPTAGAPEHTPASTPPRDERPRPRYGEYAPEGWTGVDESSISTPAPPKRDSNAPPAKNKSTRPDPVSPPRTTPDEPTAPDAASARPPRPVDRLATIMLLVVGAFGAFSSSPNATDYAQQMQTSFGLFDLGDFTAPAWLGTLVFWNAVVQLGLYAVTLGVSILRLRARRVAFWVPLAGGAASFVTTTTVSAIVLLSDPAWVEMVQSSIAP